MKLHFLLFRSFASLQEHFPTRRVKRFQVNEDACIATAAQFVWVFNTFPGRVIFQEKGSNGTKRSTTSKIKVTFLIRLVFKPLLSNLAKTHAFIIPLQWIHVKKKLKG